MADNNLIPFDPEKVTINPLAEAHKELGAVIKQLNGLQTFLRGLGEASGKSNVVDLNDLTFGFSFLLDATEASVQRANKLLSEALKGGAA
jgi:hypothetical protein